MISSMSSWGSESMTRDGEWLLKREVWRSAVDSSIRPANVSHALSSVPASFPHELHQVQVLDDRSMVDKNEFSPA